MSFKTGSILFILIFFVFSGCLKNSETFVADKNIGDINKLLNALSLNEYSFELDPQKDNTFITSNKDIINVPSNSFIDQEGKLIEGKITLKVSINPKRGIDILKQRESYSEQNLIKSILNVDVSASYNGKSLMKNPKSESIQIKVHFNKVPDISNINLMYWNADKWAIEPEGELKSKVTTANWVEETDNGTIIGSGYILDLKKFSQFLVSTSVNTPELTSVCFLLPDHFSSKNTLVYSIFVEDNYSFKLKYDDNQFCNANMPLGHIAKLVVLSEFEGKYYYSEQIFKINKGLNLSIVPKEKSLEDIKNALVNL